jgi:hypothetical protein
MKVLEKTWHGMEAEAEDIHRGKVRWALSSAGVFAQRIFNAKGPGRQDSSDMSAAIQGLIYVIDALRAQEVLVHKLEKFPAPTLVVRVA